MTEDNVRIRLRIGQLEVEYEGAPAFLEGELLGMMKKFVTFYKEHGGAIPAEPPIKHGAPHPTGSGSALDHSTNTIATLLGAKSGPDLILAAAAHYTLVLGKDRFTRRDLLGEMQTASSFYKATYNNNLTKYLERLVRADRLRLVAQDTYALSASEKQALEAKLAEQ